jgi:hypothetical protein
VARTLGTEKPTNATNQRSIGRCERKTGMARDGREFRERRHVNEPIATHFDREIVTAVFAFRAYLRRYPPRRRVIEQQRFDHRLQQVDQIVVPPHVRELVREDGLQLLVRQTGQGCRGKQDDRLQPAHQRRRGNRTRLEDADRSTQPQARRDAGGSRFHRWRHGVDGAACEPPGED